MECIYRGKTKDVYRLEDGSYLLKFKDDMTGSEGVFDPGSNTVGLAVEGAGRAGLRLTQHFFELLQAAGIPTHYMAADPEETTMTVVPAEVFGDGLEVIIRYRAVGSFLRRYGAYAREGEPLDGLVEMTLKDDERGDPPACEDILVVLGILSQAEYRIIKALAKRTAAAIRSELARKGLELYDLKLEFGRSVENGQLLLIDEISGGNMRVYRNGQPVDPLALAHILLDNSQGNGQGGR